MNIVDKILVDPITRGLKFFTKGGVPAYVSQVRGRTDGSAPAAGEIGEVITAIVDRISTQSLSSAVVKNLTSVLLPPGNWQVTGQIAFIPAGGAVVANCCALLALTNNEGQSNTNTPDYCTAGSNFTSATNTDVPLTTPTRFVNVSVATSVYLNTSVNFTPGTCVAYGSIKAVRLP